MSVEAYVDNVAVANLTPPPQPSWQNFTVHGNLTVVRFRGPHSRGDRPWTVSATSSRASHTFIVGAIDLHEPGAFEHLHGAPVRPQLELRRSRSNDRQPHVLPVAGDPVRGGRLRRHVGPCPVVEPTRSRSGPGSTTTTRASTLTLLNLKHFYSGAGRAAARPVPVILWLNANHSGSLATQVNTQLVFDNVQGQINGPGPDAVVPLGNVTISYAYSGSTSRTRPCRLPPRADHERGVPAGAFVSGSAACGAVRPRGPRSRPGPTRSSSRWEPRTGPSTPRKRSTSPIAGGQAFLNQTANTGILAGVSPAVAGTVMAIIAGDRRSPRGAVPRPRHPRWARPTDPRRVEGGPALAGGREAERLREAQLLGLPRGVRDRVRGAPAHEDRARHRRVGIARSPNGQPFPGYPDPVFSRKTSSRRPVRFKSRIVTFK